MRLKSEIFLPADYIVHKGAPGNEMYLISKGTCEVMVTDLARNIFNRFGGFPCFERLGKGHFVSWNTTGAEWLKRNDRHCILLDSAPSPLVFPAPRRGTGS